jgi:multidrug efflux pump subunit AcrA (membrane-fusion protein)
MTNHRHHATMHGLVATLTVIVLMCCGAAHAQFPGTVDLEAAEWQAAQLVGAPVFAGDTEIGTVSDVLMQEDGRIEKIRVRTGSPLGLGERILEIPESAFTVRRGTVVLELTADEVDQFPSAPIEGNSDQPTIGTDRTLQGRLHHFGIKHTLVGSSATH